MTETGRRRWWRPWQADADVASPTEAPVASGAEAPQEGWFGRLRAGLSRSSSRLKDNIAAILHPA